MPINRVVPAVPKIITDDPAQIALGIVRSAEIVSRFWAETILDNLIADPSAGGTPRKSGYAAASWIISVGGPTTLTGGSKGAPNWSPQSEGRERLTGWQLDQGAIFITNNAAHIVRLNYGWSKQAQPGFVDGCFSRAYNEVTSTFRTV